MAAVSPVMIAPTGKYPEIPTDGAYTGPFLLPTEILLDILDYVCPSITGCEILQNHLFFPSERRARFKVLRALSQTCRLWRCRFLPLLWHRLEVCTISRGFPEWKYMEQIGPALFTKSTGLLESEYLWSYVQYVSLLVSQSNPQYSCNPES
jgi:F-box-like